MRRILVTLEGAGETTCDGCTKVIEPDAYPRSSAVPPHKCKQFGGPLKAIGNASTWRNNERLPECIAAENAARELDAARNGGSK